MYTSYNGDAFYAWVQTQVPYTDPNEESKVLSRYTGNLDFMISVAAPELNTYMEVNEPSNSIVQERPDYSNLTNGIGIFSSRFRNVRAKKIHNETVQNIKNLNIKFQY